MTACMNPFMPIRHSLIDITAHRAKCAALIHVSRVRDNKTHASRGSGISWTSVGKCGVDLSASRDPLVLAVSAPAAKTEFGVIQNPPDIIYVEVVASASPPPPVNPNRWAVSLLLQPSRWMRRVRSAIGVGPGCQIRRRSLVNFRAHGTRGSRTCNSVGVYDSWGLIAVPACSRIRQYSSERMLAVLANPPYSCSASRRLLEFGPRPNRCFQY